MRRFSLTIILAGALLAGCALRPPIQLPTEGMVSLGTLGYSHERMYEERQKHLFFYLPEEFRPDPRKPTLVEHWWVPTFPIGEKRYSKWCWNYGLTCFESTSWFPAGLPLAKGDTCAVQTYQKPKIEPNITNDEHRTGRKIWVTEYHRVEQWAWRWKCDLDPTIPGQFPVWTNMAGY